MVCMLHAGMGHATQCSRAASSKQNQPPHNEAGTLFDLLPWECQALVLQHLNSLERAKLFAASHSTRRMVLAHANTVAMTTQKAAAAGVSQLHAAASCLALGPGNQQVDQLQLTLEQGPLQIVGMLTALKQGRISKLKLLVGVPCVGWLPCSVYITNCNHQRTLNLCDCSICSLLAVGMSFIIRIV